MYDWLLVGGIAVAGAIGEWGQTKWSDRKRWKANWRRLQKGSPRGTVRELLGEPKCVQVERQTVVWRYAFGGVVILEDNRLIAWTEPR